jgi:hypothetical protein
MWTGSISRRTVVQTRLNINIRCYLKNNHSKKSWRPLSIKQLSNKCEAMSSNKQTKKTYRNVCLLVQWLNFQNVGRKTKNIEK